MRTTNDFKNYVLEKLKVLGDIFCRPMMGEYLLYYKGKLFGGLYDNRFLVKKAKTNAKFNLPDAIPYPGAKLMYIVEDLEDENMLEDIVKETCIGL